MRLRDETFQKRGAEPRLADTSLAGEKHHLTFTALGFRPAPQKQVKFFFAPDESC
jgi:hypothetical protein